MRQMRPCWRSSRSTSPRRDPCRCSQADVCRRFSSRGRVCRKRSYYLSFLGSRLGEVLLLFCHRVLIVNINPMQFCKRLLLANIDRKTFSGNAVKVVGAFASNAPLQVMVGGAHRRGATMLRLMRECLSTNSALGSRLAQTLLLHFLLGARLAQTRLLHRF